MSKIIDISSMTVVRYYLAYCDMEGKDNHGLPWIHPVGQSLELARKFQELFVDVGYRRVIVFGATEVDMRLPISWTKAVRLAMLRPTD